MHLVEGNEQAGARRTMAQLCVAAGSLAESAECNHAWIELHHVFQGLGWLVRTSLSLSRRCFANCFWHRRPRATDNIAVCLEQVYSYDTVGWTEFISVAAKDNKSVGSKKRRPSSGDVSGTTGGTGRKGRRRKSRP
jgi:hypothetical protein